MTPADDPLNLARFVAAQEGVYPRALSELRAGLKQSHWMWFVLPQLEGLGRSELARRYGVRSLVEARAYLEHPILGPRLRECVSTLNLCEGRSAEEVLGAVDAMKLRSCLTLFQAAAGPGSVFAEGLGKYFAGVPDEATLGLLAEERRTLARE